MSSTLTNTTLFEFSESFSVFISFVISTFTIHFLLGFFLNCFIIFVLLSKGRQVYVSVIFTLNHTAAEVIFSILSLIYILTIDKSSSTFVILLDFLFGTSMSARLLFLCCVCLERYLAVVHPVTFLRFKPFKYRVACSITVWICALVLGTCACTSTLPPYKLVLAVNIITFSVEFFCCVSILKQLRHPGPRDMEREQVKMSATKKKAFQIIFINLLAGLTQNIPLAISYCFENILSFYDFRVVLFICTTVHIFAGFVQPAFVLHKAAKRSLIKCS